MEDISLRNSLLKFKKFLYEIDTRKMRSVSIKETLLVQIKIPLTFITYKKFVVVFHGNIEVLTPSIL